MVGRPFGSDEAGRPVGRTKGTIMRATVEYMLECVARRAVDSGRPPEDARSAALDKLISRLNASISDSRYHVTSDYLMDEGHSYSVEFNVFLSDICRDLSGDPSSHFNCGVRGTPAAVLVLASTLSLARSIACCPALRPRWPTRISKSCPLAPTRR